MGQVLAPGMHHMRKIAQGRIRLSFRRRNWYYEVWQCRQLDCLMKVDISSSHPGLTDVTYLGVVKLHNGHMTPSEVLMQYESQESISDAKLLRVKITVRDIEELRTIVRRIELMQQKVRDEKGGSN